MKRKKIRPFDRGGEWGYDKKKRQVRTVRPRKKPLGDKNLVGARVTEARRRKKMKQVDLLVQLQLRGIDLSVPALSLLEGQKRPVTDRELVALSEILDVSVDYLLGNEEEEPGT